MKKYLVKLSDADVFKENSLKSNSKNVAAIFKQDHIHFNNYLRFNPPISIMYCRH